MSLPVPYTSKLEGVVSPGQSIFIKGHANGGRFDISILCGANVAGGDRSDIALTLSVRVNDGKLILNSLKGGEWGKEITHKLNFKKTERFEFRVRAHDDKFEIFENGKELQNFEYRMPLSNVNHIYVVGEVQLQRCDWEGQYYAVPYERALPANALAPPHKLYIAGVAEKKAKRFSINFMAGDDVALQFNPRLDEKKIVRNSKRGGAWDDVEEREGPDFPMERAHAFDVEFLSEPNCFRIVINDEEFCSYNHRVPPQNITALTVEGDVELQAIHWK